MPKKSGRPLLPVIPLLYFPVGFVIFKMYSQREAAERKEKHMKISEIAEVLSAEVKTCAEKTHREVRSAYAGDMLSDVLSLGAQPDILLTGLLNPQVIRTAEMLDTVCVVFLRGKKPGEDILSLAESCGICVLVTAEDTFEASAALSRSGIRGAR